MNCKCVRRRGWEVRRLLPSRKISESQKTRLERQEPVQVMVEPEEKDLKKATTASNSAVRSSRVNTELER